MEKNIGHIKLQILIQNTDEIEKKLNHLISKLKEAKSLADEIASIEITFQERL